VPEGAYVVNVVTGSPAEKAGILPGDVIYKVDGQAINEGNGGLAKIIADKKVGDGLNIELWRSGETKTLKVTLSEFSQ
jgi:serine protease Do